MINTEFLSDEEIMELTGSKQASAQKRWLTENDINFLVNKQSKPVISRYALRLKMSNTTPTAIAADKQEIGYEFNFKNLG